jgi:electron transfer flavoprotein beta subunit
MRVLVCIKRVPAPGARILVTEDGLGVDAAHLAFTISPHEECAVEEAVRLAEAHGGTSHVVAVGPPEAEEQLRYAVSVGIGTGSLVETDGSDWDPVRTARALRDAVDALETDGGTFDLILVGNESADSGGFQVGIRLAHSLGRPMVNGAKGIDVADGSVTVHRPVDAGAEVYRLPTPAVIGIREGINLPRYPTLKGRLASKKAEIARIDSRPEPGGQRLITLERPVEEIEETVVLGTGPDAAPALVDVLVELGVV